MEEGESAKFSITNGYDLDGDYTYVSFAGSENFENIKIFNYDRIDSSSELIEYFYTDYGRSFIKMDKTKSFYAGVTQKNATLMVRYGS
jgi:hypothetical protein